MLSWSAQFLKSQLLTTIPYPTSDFTGQTVIVTGSNTGLAFEAANHIVRLGAHKIILGVRTVSKGEAAAQSIVQRCNVPKARVEVWQLDMGDTKSIKTFAKRAEGLERLDAAVLNAGILTNKYATVDGLESHVAVNVVGTMLLACLLLPKLRAAAEQTSLRGRLTIVGSDLMYLADTKELQTDGSIVAKLNDPAASSIKQRYALSKLLVLYSLRELARQHPVDETSVLLSVLTPGACKSEIFRDEAGRISKVFMGATMAAVARTTEVGGRTLVYGVSPDLPLEAHGRFLMDNKIFPDGANVDSPSGQRLAAKWNKELFAHLERAAPCCAGLHAMLIGYDCVQSIAGA